MSEAPELPEAEALAAEHALGVLSGPERAEAEARMAREPAFAAAVEAWRQRLGPLLDGVAAVAPPAGLWDRIERRLPANDNAADRRLTFWRRTALGSMGLAAAGLVAVVVLANQPPVIVQPAPQVAQAPAPILNASLMPNAAKETGAVAQPLFVAAYDPMRKALIVTSLVPPGADPLHVHQLWLIPGDGKPRSLGMIEPGTSKSMPMPATLDQLVTEGAQIAVSVEEPGGSKNPDGPQGPIAAQGPLKGI